jgi:hypothetical protein
LYKGIVRAPEAEEEKEDEIEQKEIEPNTTEVWVADAGEDPYRRPSSPYNEESTSDQGPTYIQGQAVTPRRSGTWGAIKQKMINFRKEADQSARRLVVQLRPLGAEQLGTPNITPRSQEEEVLNHPALPRELRRSTRNSKPVKRLNL